MKKVLLALLVCAMVVLTACSTNEHSGDGDDASVAVTLPEYVSYTVLSESYSLEDAISDRCAVLVDLIMTSGVGEWSKFLEMTQNGEAAAIRLAQYYTQSARLYLTDLSFDGSAYTVSDYTYSDRNGQYQYFTHYVNIVGSDPNGPTLDCFMLLDEEIDNYTDIESTLAANADSVDPYRIYVKQIPDELSNEADSLQQGEVWNETEHMEMLQAYLDRNGLPESYVLDDAIADGCVAWVDTEIQSGEDAWLGFAETTLGGMAASIRLAKYYSTYSALYFTDIAFDGTVYTVTEMDGTSKQFKYLNDYELPEEEPYSSKFDSYVLVNDKNVPLMELGWSLSGLHDTPYIEQYRISSVNPLYLSALTTDDAGTWFYPVLPGDEEWADLQMEEAFASLNMPDDQLAELSGDELAALVLEYPYWGDINAFNDAKDGFETVKGRSNICTAFFERDDAMDLLLAKYDAMAVDYYVFLDPSVKVVLKDSGQSKENFLQTYFGLFSDEITPEQLQKLSRIFWEKYEIRKQTNLYDTSSYGLGLYALVASSDSELSREEMIGRFNENSEVFNRVVSMISDQKGTFWAGYCPERYPNYENKVVLKGKLFVYTDIASINNLDPEDLQELYDDVIHILDDLGFNEIRKFDDEYSQKRVTFGAAGTDVQQSIIFDGEDALGASAPTEDYVDIEKLADNWYYYYFDVTLWRSEHF